jgi:Kinesin-associated protein (KAP)
MALLCTTFSCTLSHSLTHTHTHTRNLSPSHSLTLSHIKKTPSLTYSRMHIHLNTLTTSPPLTLLFHSPSLSITTTHTRTHTHSHILILFLHSSLQLIQNNTVMGALTRVLQEEFKKSTELTFNILRYVRLDVHLLTTIFRSSYSVIFSFIHFTRTSFIR